MAKKLTPAQLRAKAKALQMKATEEENKRYIRIGKLIEKKIIKAEFSSIDVAELKREVQAILPD